MILAIVERFENIKEEAPFNNRYYLTEYYKKIFDELDVLLFPIVSDKNLKTVCDICDGLIVTGSCIDINPSYYNEESIKGKKYDIDEFKFDKAIIELFSNAHKPILGICGGMQTLNVYFGGDLNQNVLNHQLEDNSKHKAKIMQDSFLYSVYQKEDIEINSFHRQAVRKLANNFKVTATSEDGIIEAIEYGNIIGVQWHPEALKDIEFFDKFFKTFVK